MLTRHGASAIMAVLLLILVSDRAVATTFYTVTIDTSAVAGTGGQLVLDFVTGAPPSSNHVEIVNFSAPGSVAGLPQTQGGLVVGGLILPPFNSASFTEIEGGSFFNELLVNFLSFGNSISFVVEMPEIGPSPGGIPDEFSLYLLDSSGLPLFPTSDPLGANALLSIDITGQSGGNLSVFSPTVFTPPNDLMITVPGAPVDTTPPVTAAASFPKPNANGWNNTNVKVDLNSTDDEPGGTGVKEIRFILSGAQTGSSVIPGSTASVIISAEGITNLTYFAIDNAGNQETANSLTVKIDKTAPLILGLPAPGCMLWPPNHKLVVVATVTASDALSGLASFGVSGSSSEPSFGGEMDIVIGGSAFESFVVQLRSERLGAGEGRIYTLTAAATDLAGNGVTDSATCLVPHDQARR